MSLKSRTRAAGLLIVPLLVLPGCDSSGSGGGQDPGPSGAPAAVPEFSGPYAAEFAESYRSAGSEFVRGALADEEISDSEYAEMTERFRKCLADVGITFKGFDATGAYSTSLAPDPDDTHDLVEECVVDSGQDAIGLLRDLTTLNPQNLDAATIIAECLVREGVVPPGYGADDYTTDAQGRLADRDALPDDLRDARDKCSSNPLGVG